MDLAAKSHLAGYPSGCQNGISVVVPFADQGWVSSAGGGLFGLSPPTKTRAQVSPEPCSHDILAPGHGDDRPSGYNGFERAMQPTINHFIDATNLRHSCVYVIRNRFMLVVASSHRAWSRHRHGGLVQLVLASFAHTPHFKQTCYTSLLLLLQCSPLRLPSKELCRWSCGLAFRESD